MSTAVTHYPAYDVLKKMDEWDSHTKEIVRKRLGPFPALKSLSEKEARFITAIAMHIVYDHREEIFDWVVHHIDQKLNSEIGEDQRKVGTPPEKVLIRDGLKALDQAARLSFQKHFGELAADRQFRLLADLQQGKAAWPPEWSHIPQQELFTKLAAEITSAYYSHPAVWSEIGYGGPMYPQIYVRIERGLTDPGEAKRDGK